MKASMALPGATFRSAPLRQQAGGPFLGARHLLDGPRRRPVVSLRALDYRVHAWDADPDNANEDLSELGNRYGGSLGAADADGLEGSSELLQNIVASYSLRRSPRQAASAASSSLSAEEIKDREFLRAVRQNTEQNFTSMLSLDALAAVRGAHPGNMDSAESIWRLQQEMHSARIRDANTGVADARKNSAAALRTALSASSRSRQLTEKLKAVRAKQRP